jgi:hypothetical protein
MTLEESLVWPDHYPPKTRWKRFFIGVRFLGPDLSFFKDFEKRQGRRTASSMEVWTVDLERRLALLIGERFREQKMGWKTPFFLPSDSFGVIVNGPRFRAIDDLAALAAIESIERAVGRKFPDEFWSRACDLTLREVVLQMLEHGAAA